MRRRGMDAETVSHERWLVSYSDFVTLLFAFFVVLFASAHRDNLSIVKVSHSIHSGFQTLGAFPDAQVQDRRPASNGDRSNAIVPAVPQPEAATAANKPRRPLSAQELEALRRELQSAVGVELQNHQVAIRSTSEGIIISLKELGFFDSGQAVLLPGAAQKIRRITSVLQKHHLRIRIEGHSDDQPIHSARFRDNWELSTARAMTVLSLLVNEAGYDPASLSVAGYGQYSPLADNNTLEGRRVNRRVDLVVQQ